MSEWHRALIAETRASQGLPPTIADDPVGIELAARFLTSASSTDSSALRRAAVESVEHGAVGPRDIRGAHDTGSASAATVGPSANKRPAAPTTNKTPPVAASGVKNNAG